MENFINLFNFEINFVSLFTEFNSFSHMILTIFDILCVLLDNLIYNAAAGMYNIFIAFATTNITETFTGLDAITDRLYLLIGVFMLFRASFSFLTYLVSPDKMSDNNNGAVAIVRNIVISVALFAVIPVAFDWMMDLQDSVIQDQIIEKLILGSGDSNIESNSLGTGEKNLTEDGKKTTVDFGEKFAYITWAQFFSDSSNKSCDAEKENCHLVLSELAYCVTGECRESDLVSELHLTEDDEVNYYEIVSGICGILLVMLLLSFTIDIGIRAFKLLFFELVAPVAVILYIDPKGQQKFWNWVKNTLFTFLDLFIRLLIVFLAIAIVSNVPELFKEGTKSFLSDLSGFSKALAYMLLVLSIFGFAKQVPKLFGDLFGIDTGSMSLNPFKQAGFGGFFGGVLGGGIGALAGGVLGAANAKRSGEKGVKGKLKSIGSMAGGFLGGGLSGAGRGIGAGSKSQKFTDLYKNAKQGVTNQNQARINRRKNGGMFSRGRTAVSGALSSGRMATLQSQRAAYSSAADRISKAKETADKLTGKNLENIQIKDSDGNMTPFKNIYGTITDKDDYLRKVTEMEAAKLEAVRNDPNFEEKDFRVAQENYYKKYTEAEDEWNNIQKEIVANQVISSSGEIYESLAASNRDLEAGGLDTLNLDEFKNKSKTLGKAKKDINTEITKIDNDPVFKKE